MKLLNHLFFILLIVCSLKTNAQEGVPDDLKLPHLLKFDMFPSNENCFDSINKTQKNSYRESKNRLFSIEPFVYMPYYFVFSNKEIYNEQVMYYNSWNVGAGALLSMYVGSIKVSAGIDFSTKNYYRGNYSANTIVDKINYRNFVIQVSYKPFSRFSPFIGFVTKRPINYNNETNIKLQRELRDSLHFPKTHMQIVYDESYPMGYYFIYVEDFPLIYLNNNLHYNLRIGINNNTPIFTRFSLKINLFCDFKINAWVNDIFISGNEINLSTGRFSVGINLGFETYINKDYKGLLTNY